MKLRMHHFRRLFFFLAALILCLSLPSVPAAENEPGPLHAAGTGTLSGTGSGESFLSVLKAPGTVRGEIIFGESTVRPQEEKTGTPAPETTPGPDRSSGQGGIIFGDRTIRPQEEETETPAPVSPTVQPNTQGVIIFGNTTISPSATTPPPAQEPTRTPASTPAQKPDQNPAQKPTQNPAGEPVKAKTRRVLMLYMVGSNLESQYGYASKDLFELLDAHLDLDNTTVYLCAGGAKSWYALNLGPGEVAYYCLSGSGYISLTQPRQLSMGRPATLSSFLKYCLDHSSADAYSLILWDHGGGPIFGYGQDEAHGNDTMSLEQLASALRDGGFGGKKKLEVLAFDACLMGNLETASFMAAYADYMLASEESLPALGMDYSKLNAELLTGPDTLSWLKEFASDTVDELCRYYKDTAGAITLSVYSLSRLSSVTAELNNLFSGSFNQDACVAVSRRLTGVKHVDHDRYIYDLYDLYGFANSYTKKETNLQDILGQLVVANYGNQESQGLNGVSFYFPLLNSNEKQKSVSEYKQIAAIGNLGNYYQFLLSYIKNVRGIFGKSLPPMTRKALGGNEAEDHHNQPSAEVQRNVSAANSVTLTEKGLRFEVPLNIELINSFVQSYYLILQKDGPDTYRLVEQGHGLNMTEEGMLSVILDPHIRMVSGRNGQQQILPFTENERGSDYLTGGTRLLRRRFNETQMMSARIVHNRDVPSGRVEKISPYTENPMGTRINETPEPEDCLTPVYQVRKMTLDEYGEPLPFFFWEEADTGIVYGKEFTVGEEGLHIDFVPIASDEEYYLQMCVEDVYGVTYATSLSPLHLKEDW